MYVRIEYIYRKQLSDVCATCTLGFDSRARRKYCILDLSKINVLTKKYCRVLYTYVQNDTHNIMNFSWQFVVQIVVKIDTGLYMTLLDTLESYYYF